MWWRLAVLTGLFFGVSRVWVRESTPYRGTCIVYYNSANGHYYQWVQTGRTSWLTALEQANNTYFAGAQGHLATITSKQEQEFLKTTYQIGSPAWIAATDRGQEGVWKWAAGDEAGDTFYVASEAPSEEQFSAWIENEPNDHDGDEDYAAIGWQGSVAWNDLHETRGGTRAYLVEYDGLPRPEKLVITSGNTRSPVYGNQRPTINFEKDGVSWQW